LEDLGVDGKIVFKWIFEKYDGRVQTGFFWLRLDPVEGSCEHSNKPLGSMKGGDFPE
jgi:hypothetical protein